MSAAGKTTGADSFGVAPTVRPATPAITKPVAPASVPEQPPAPKEVKRTGKALRAAIEKSKKELDGGAAVAASYAAERRKVGTAGLWGETDVTEQVLAKTGSKG